MHSNCSLHRLPPLDPMIDPAYVDGPIPRTRRPPHVGEIPTLWPVGRLPLELLHVRQVSIEALEDTLERDARREERDE